VVTCLALSILRTNITPSYEAFCEQVAAGSNLIAVYREILSDTETPVSAFLKLKKGPYAYLLESVEGGEKWGRYSFLGTKIAGVVRCVSGQATLTWEDDVPIAIDGPPLQALKQILSRFHTPAFDEGSPPPFWGGLLGYFSYEAVRFFESVLPHPSPNHDDFLFFITRDLLVFDNQRHRIRVVSNVWIDDCNKPKELRFLYEQAVAKINEMIASLAEAAPVSITPSFPQSSTPVRSEKSNFSRDTFKQAVLQAQEYIRAGDIFQVQVARRTEVSPIRCDPLAIYRALRVMNPSPYLFYFEMGERVLIGSSPEVLVRVDTDRVETRPIAGTRRRGASPEEDQRLESELLADPKERAEHLMLVDLGRNDIGRVCQYGTVQVDELMVIERYSHVMHIVSNIVGKRREDCDAFDVLTACFPAGTVTGAPKIRAMEIIKTLEPDGRGVYAGAFGYFGFQGNLEMCITIRTMVIDDQRASVQSAAGIVADSLPDAEYEETVNKAHALWAALHAAEDGNFPSER